MYFGQKIHKIEGRVVKGKWLPFDSQRAALRAGCAFISVLERTCSVEDYQKWEETAARGARFEVPFRGPFYADFDDREDVDGLKDSLGDCCRKLIRSCGLNAADFQLWFSGGKGFHLLIDAAVFNARGFSHPRLPRIYKRFGEMLGFGALMDGAVYSLGKGRLWRVEGIKRENGLAKVRIGLDQLRSLDEAALKERARAGLARSASRNHPRPNGTLSKIFADCVKAEEMEVEARRQKASRLEHGRANITRRGDGKVDWQRVAEALNSMPDERADDYQSWLTIGMALHDADQGGRRGFDLWMAFSARSEKFDPFELEKRWEQFNAGGGITLGTLFEYANQS